MGRKFDEVRDTVPRKATTRKEQARQYLQVVAIATQARNYKKKKQKKPMQCAEAQHWNEKYTRGLT
jgi:hypothetical protein